MAVDGKRGPLAPVIEQKVGRKSIVEASSLQMLLASILPGQRAIIGKHMPPSMVLPFAPDKGRLDPPFRRLDPLSEVKITKVFSVRLSRSKVSRISPVDQSISSIESP